MRAALLKDLGWWGPLVRELSGYDPAKAEEILRWPVVEALAAYENRLRERARRQYELEVLVWSVLAQAAGKKAKKPPKLPAILRPVRGDSEEVSV